MRILDRIFSMPWLRLAILLCAMAVTTGSWAATGTVLQGSTLYPRVVRLAHGPANVNGRLIASTNDTIFQSVDDGVSWSGLGTVPTIGGSSERCCATLYELPRAVGSLAAGTLLSAAAYSSGGIPAIEVYTSTDQGAHWSYHSTPVRAGDANHGVWEPEFEVANDGALVMFWSDETDPCCSQKLAQVRTYDGLNWQNPTDTVRSTVSNDRPGMITVSQLPNGHFFMSYELCGPAACTVFSRVSVDGWYFGDPTNMGAKVQTATGQYLEHAPFNHWTPSVLSAGNGAILLVGQVMYESSGSVSPSNGKVLFVNTHADGTGNWFTIDAPVQVPGAYDNYCPNYSSALLPEADGSGILELASDYLNGGCITYFARMSWNRLPADGSTWALKNVFAPALCLDNTGWSTANNTAAELWTCNGLSVQRWTFHAQGDSYFSLQNQATGLCLDNTGGSATRGNLVTLWGCVSNANQSWQVIDVGHGSYKLITRASGDLALDDPAGSTTAGTQLQIYTDNGLGTQQWVLQ